MTASAAFRELQSSIELFSREMIALGAPAVIVEARSGAQGWKHAAGFRNIATGTPAGPDDSMVMGGVSRSMLAVSVLKLAEEGLLVLDAPASAYLAPADIPPGGAAATIRGVLADPDSGRTDLLLRRVVEVLRGTGYSEVLARDILDPLGLRTVAVYGPEPIPPGVVHGYVQLNGKTVDVMETGALGSRGAQLFGTVGDINAFYSGLLGGKLVAPSSLILMKGSVLAEYGLGLDQWQDPCTNGNYYGHAGDVPGYGVMSLSSADANRQITIAVAYPPAPLAEAPSAVALEITSLAQVVLNAGCRFRFG